MQRNIVSAGEPCRNPLAPPLGIDVTVTPARADKTDTTSTRVYTTDCTTHLAVWTAGPQGWGQFIPVPTFMLVFRCFYAKTVASM